MRKSRAVILILLALVAIIGAKVFWPQAFPTATIDFQLTQVEIKTRLTQTVETLGFPVSEYHHVVSFGEDTDTARYIELEYGVPRLEQLTKGGLNVWYWGVRWFKPEQHEEFGASMDPQGRMVGFSHTIEEEKEVPSLDEKAARAVAEEFLRRFIPHHPLDKLRFVSVSSDEKPHRTDFCFTWERDDFRLGEAPYRLDVTVKGNQVGHYGEYVKVPEGWTRDFNKKRETNNLCMNSASAALMAILVGYVVVLVVSIRNHNLRWRDALPWGWFALFAVVEILAKVNAIPELLADYETTEKWLPFIGRNLFSTVRDVLLSVGALWLLVLVADALYREKFPRLFSFRRGLGIEGFRDARTGRSLLIGVVFALVGVAYVSGFYVLGRHWGAWAPVEIEYAKTLSGWFPWIAPIETGLSAAFLEEMLFRIVGLVVFWKVVRVRWLAVLLASATWAFLHSSYPQMPGYVRGLELTLVGIVWSVLLLRYGVLTTLTAHYLYDCWLGEMVVFQSASWMDRAGALVGSCWPLVFLGVSWWLCRRAGEKELPQEPEEIHAAPLPDAADSPAPGAFRLLELTRKQRGLVFLAALVTLVACYRLSLPQDSIRALGNLGISRKDIAVAADEVVKQQGFDPARYRRIVTCHGGTSATDYLLEKGTYERVANLYRTEMPDVYWSARYFRILEKEELRVKLDQHGRLLEWNHMVPREAPGASLTGEAALALAKKTLAEHGADVGLEKLVSQSPNRQEHRLDYSFTFERTNWQWGDAKLRTSIRLIGDEPVGFSRYVKVPEAWLLERQKSGWKKFVTSELSEWLTMAEAVLTLVLFILLVAKHRVPWRQGFLIAIVPATIGAGLLWDQAPWFYSGYKTTMPLANYLATHWLSQGLGVVLGYLGSALTIGVALGFVRWAFGWELANLTLWPRERAQRSAFWTSTLLSAFAGYALLFAFARFDLFLRGHFLPASCGGFSWPAANTAVPWLRDLLSAVVYGLHRVIALATVWSVVTLLYRRFPRLTAALVVLYPILGAVQHDSWAGFFCGVVSGELSLALTFFLVFRVFRFNAVGLWLTYTLSFIISEMLSYASHGGSGYRWEWIPMALGIVLPLLIGWGLHRRWREVENTVLKEPAFALPGEQK